MRTFIEEVDDKPKTYAKASPKYGKLYNLRAAEARAPYAGAQHERRSRVVQSMIETEKALLLYDFAADCQFWMPKWLLPRGCVVEMPGEAGPVPLPSYFLARLGIR